MTSSTVEPPRDLAPQRVDDGGLLRAPGGDSPFKGLGYYEEADAPYFFGREQETRVVAANLVASRLTVLYGESGVGKSSLLRAGVTRHLMEIARENVERRGTPRQVVAVFPSEEGGARTTWRDDPVPAIAGAIDRAVASLGLDVPSPPPGRDLCRLLAAWTERLGSDVLLILDQFEEYVLYHGGEDGQGTLATELPRVVSQPNLRVNVLISIRQDMLAVLDTFKRRIPTIFDTRVRVDRLSRPEAREAIEKPIAKYNKVHASDERIVIEPPLVDALLHELEAGRVVAGVAGAGASYDHAEPDAHPVEMPFLQLVMTRLWAAETRTGSRTLRLATLDRLGHCERIIKTHLDDRMRALPPYARTVAAQAFHHLVTPSGSKIAHTPADLAAYSGLAVDDIEPVLERLTDPEYRILRRVVRSTAEDAPAHFEIFHDVLGTPVLDWRARYLRTREVLHVLRGGLTAFVHVVFGIVWVVLVAASVNALSDDYDPGDGSEQFLLAWTASAVLVWLSTTAVLVRRRRRLEAWVVPLVGVVAAVVGPVTVLVSVGIRLLRPFGRRRRRQRRRGVAASQRTEGVGLLRFSGLLSLVAAAVLVLACSTAAVSGLADIKLGDSVETRDISASFLAGGEARWLALQPLAASALVGIAGLLALRRPRSRQFLPGVVSGMGISGLAYFLALLVWPDALTLFVVGAAWEADLGVSTGIPLGLAGAALMLVSSAPLVLDVFASIIGAERTLARSARQALALDRSTTRSAMQKPLGALAFAAAAVVALAATLPGSGAWLRDGSMFEISFWAGFQVVAPAVAAGTAAIVLAYSAGISGRAAGCISGTGIALVATFAAAAATAPDAAMGHFLGLGAGAMLFATGIAARIAVSRPLSQVGADRSRLARRAAAQNRCVDVSGVPHTIECVARAAMRDTRTRTHFG